jgi:hypothetical protein
MYEKTPYLGRSLGFSWRMEDAKSEWRRMVCNVSAKGFAGQFECRQLRSGRIASWGTGAAGTSVARGSSAAGSCLSGGSPVGGRGKQPDQVTKEIVFVIVVRNWGLARSRT